MSAAVEGSQVDFATASRIESRYFVSLATGQIAKNMIQAFFFDLQAINAGASRPSGVPRSSARKVGVLGAGMMGAGIAYVCAKAGLEVVLKDVSLEAASKGKAYSEKLLAKQVQKGRTSAGQVEEFLSRITPTADPNDLAGCDLVIEAVFESEELKQKVFAEIAGVVEPDALLCSNTSTLPITSLADGIERPDDFIGMHFFSPVDRMPLVELIVGEKTSDRAVARAYDVVRQIKKTPIVVNDSRGFFTSRVFGTLVMEGAAMVAEGIDPVMIERAATQAGFPAPPLAMLDEVTLTLPQKIRDAAKAAGDSAGAFDGHPGMAVTDRLVNEFDRRGKAAGAGFYDYPADGPKRLWPGLWEHFARDVDVPLIDLQERMTFAMSLETVKCLDEGVLRSVADANVGSIFGIGFPPLHGGALQYINAYGLPAFVERSRVLAAAYGARFEPPALLVRKAEAGELFR
jgi:3-hydroxyacyl-CoA dehydrogenase/enoyl-CoA hydratase/3-hydroxybutyryl-CoA epimerase